MVKKLTLSEMLLLCLLDIEESNYRDFYLQILSEWQLRHFNGWSIASVPVWSNWWPAEWNQLTEGFANKIKVSEDGQFYVLIEQYGAQAVITGKAKIEQVYRQYMSAEMLSEAKHNAREIRLHETIQALNKKRNEQANQR